MSQPAWLVRHQVIARQGAGSVVGEPGEASAGVCPLSRMPYLLVMVWEYCCGVPAVHGLLQAVGSTQDQDLSPTLQPSEENHKACSARLRSVGSAVRDPPAASRMWLMASGFGVQADLGSTMNPEP